MTRSLRPLEWFNLAKRHGWAQFLLHDDFYDEDGTATQPEEVVEQSERFQAPTLAAVSDTAETLLDYAITRWQFDAELGERWRQLPQDEVLRTLTSRFDASNNLSVRSVVLEVANLLGSSAESLVRRAWAEYPDGIVFWSLVQASAACLPFEEGFARAENALAGMPDRTRRDRFSALAHFRSPRALRWIELNAAEPTVEAWGRLAAASAFSWPKAEEWLHAGRPLSLIAIDALLAIAEPQTPFLRDQRPSLGAPASAFDARKVLEAVAVADPVPRVKQRIGALLVRLSVLTQPS
ncbi:hypothetical protein ACQ86G_27970 [Roseateles chitinivorans]|uniref:hypothetical protein n=1 Tax=Roseateles chitinivorans TaxID=2917965 RepID=UPI003D673454